MSVLRRINGPDPPACQNIFGAVPGGGAPNGRFASPPDSRALAHLRYETRPLINRLYRHPMLETLLDGTMSKDQYVALLVRLWGFYRPYDRWIMRQLAPWSGPLLLMQRQKAQLVVQDLLWYGMPLETIRAVPCCTELTEHSGSLFALGSLYAAEAITLMGHRIAHHAGAMADGSPPNGWRFFYNYGAAAPNMWRTLTQTIGELADGAGKIDPLVAGANDLYQALYRWLDAGDNASALTAIG